MKHHGIVEFLARGVCIKKGRLLVCQSKGAANTYLPGGHVEFGEQAVLGLVREIEEELGVKARVGAFLGAVEHEYMQKGERHCEVNLMFRVVAPSLNPDREPASREDWISFRWIPMASLGRYHLEPWPLRKLIPAWVRAGMIPCRWGSSLAKERIRGALRLGRMA